MSKEPQRVKVPVDEAVQRLAVIEDYDAGTGPAPCVHTFADAGFGLLGAHWYLSDIEPFFEAWGVEESGPAAQASGHGLVVIADGGKRTIFFETKPAPKDPAGEPATEEE